MSHSRTILLVEVEAETAGARRRALERCGYTVIIVASNGEALEWVRSDPGIDLVIAGVDPGDGINGPEAAEAILAERTSPSSSIFIPVLSDRIPRTGPGAPSVTATPWPASVRPGFRSRFRRLWSCTGHTAG